LPTIRQIEQQAYIWANQEIMTYELAEEYLSRRRARKDIIGQLKHMMGIYDRTLTKTETDYLTDWLDKGFGYEAIAIAFDRTVTQTGGLKWAYMNKIMQSWHSKNLHTPEEIAAGDKPMSKKNSQPDRQPANNIAGGELERLKRIFGDM